MSDFKSFGGLIPQQIFKALTPDMPTIKQPKVAPTPDDMGNKAAKRRKKASAGNSGRASTVLTQGSDKLG